MTTPTREQVVRWMGEAELHTDNQLSPGEYHPDYHTVYAENLSALARADLEATIAEQAAEIERLRGKIFVGPEAFRAQGVSPQALLTSPGGGDDSTGTIPDMYHESENCMQCLQRDKKALVAINAELTAQRDAAMKDAERLREVFRHDYPRDTYRIQISLGEYHYKKLIPIDARGYIGPETERIAHEIDAAIAKCKEGK